MEQRSSRKLEKNVLRITRALLSELQLRPDSWPDLVPLFQSAINQSLSPQRGDISLLTAFTGRRPSPSIATFLRSDNSAPVIITAVQYEKAFNTTQIISIMQEMHSVIQMNLKESQ